MYLLFLLIAIVLFLYGSWKALKEDFASQEVLGFTWQLILGMILISRIAGGDWKDGPWWQILAIWNPMKVNYFVGLLGGVLLSALGGTAINMVALAGVSMAVAGIAALLVIKE